MDAIASLGLDEHLAGKLKAEKARLLDLRQALARSSSAPKATAAERQVTVRQMLDVLANIEQAAARSPERAREALAGLVERIPLTPEGGGYRAQLAFRNKTPALEVVQGGRFALAGCGGLIPPSTNRALDSTFFLPKLHAPRFGPPG